MAPLATATSFLDAILRVLREGATIISVPHLRGHEALAYKAGVITADGDPLADDATLALGITVPKDLEGHLVWFAAAGGDAEIEWAELTEFNSGSDVTPRNLNRESARLARISVVVDPTVTELGDLLDCELLPGGTGGNASGGGLRPDTEWILAPDRTYLLRLTNRSGQAKPASLGLQWYEEEE